MAEGTWQSCDFEDANLADLFAQTLVAELAIKSVLTSFLETLRADHARVVVFGLRATLVGGDGERFLCTGILYVVVHQIIINSGLSWLAAEVFNESAEQHPLTSESTVNQYQISVANERFSFDVEKSDKVLDD